MRDHRQNISHGNGVILSQCIFALRDIALLVSVLGQKMYPSLHDYDRQVLVSRDSDTRDQCSLCRE